MILKPTPIHSTAFTFSKSTFVAEMSDLGNPLMGRVYDDACDIGFSVISAKTGKHAVFAFESTDRDGEGEAVGFRFTCVTPGLKHLRALLIND